MEPIDIAKQIVDTEKRIDDLAIQRPGMLADLMQHYSDGNEKAAAKVKGEIADLDIRRDMTQQRLLDLNNALKQTIQEQIKTEIEDLPETGRLLKDEVLHAAEEIGELLARTQYLEEHYLFGSPYNKWLNSVNPLGHRNPPPEGMGAVFNRIGETKARTLEALAGTDPNCETYQARKMAYHDAERQMEDPRIIDHSVKKRIAIVMREAKTGVK